VPKESQGAEECWLTLPQLDAWKSVVLLMARLRSALEEQMKCDAQLSCLEYDALAGLSEQPDHTMRMSRLAVLTNAELSRLSHLISRLEGRGLVRRQLDPTDRRFTNVVLTEAGYAHLAAAEPGHARKVRELVIDVLEPEALKTLKACADQINEKIGSHES
jgi:DNA-binding MarR family transcriptional regulator